MNKRLSLAYLAGPYRGPGANDVWENICSARAAARGLWKKGYAVICPHTNNIFMEGDDLSHEDFMAGDLEIISRCDIIVMMPNWECSEGSCIERSRAIELGMPVYLLGEEPNMENKHEK